MNGAANRIGATFNAQDISVQRHAINPGHGRGIVRRGNIRHQPVDIQVAHSIAHIAETKIPAG